MRDRSGSNLIPALRRRFAASRDKPPDAVGELANCLIDCWIELRRIVRAEFLAKNKTKFLAKHNKKVFGKHLTLHPAGRSPQKTHGVNEALVGQSALVLVAGKWAVSWKTGSWRTGIAFSSRPDSFQFS
jgi:hypothetical protein